MTTDKTAETTELSQDQFDLVVGGIYFHVPKLQTAAPTPVWSANVVNAELGTDRLVNLPF